MSNMQDHPESLVQNFHNRLTALTIRRSLDGTSSVSGSHANMNECQNRTFSG